MLTRAFVVSVLPLALSTILAQQPDRFQRVDGGIVRGSTETRQLALVFTGHEFAEGAATILEELDRRGLKASFFLTGAFLRDRGKAPLVRRMVREGHYVGPHSDAHLLYAPWTGPKVTLVSRETFAADLDRNIDALRPFGVSRAEVRFFLPSYEWYTKEIVEWTRAAGLTLVCHTPGTRSNADYTEEGTTQFVATDAIFESILKRERDDPHGLNGFLLLLHVGAGPGRADKFHRRFGELLDVLSGRGYAFARVDALLAADRKRVADHADQEKAADFADDADQKKAADSADDADQEKAADFADDADQEKAADSADDADQSSTFILTFL